MPKPLAVGDNDEQARFRSYVVHGPRRSSCAIWIGAIADDGYGRFWISRGGQPRVVRPHRYALAIALGGSIDESVNALHMCDNPICVRVTLDEAQQQPLHVVDGNQSQNLRDMAAKGRGGGRRQPGLWYGPDRAARAARSRRLRAAVRTGWDDAAVQAALLESGTPTLF